MVMYQYGISRCCCSSSSSSSRSSHSGSSGSKSSHSSLVYDCGICSDGSTPSGMIIELDGIRYDEDYHSTSEYMCWESDLGDSGEVWYDFCHHLDGSYDVPNQQGWQWEQHYNECSGAIRTNYCKDGSPSGSDQIYFDILWRLTTWDGEAVVEVELRFITYDEYGFSDTLRSVTYRVALDSSSSSSSGNSRGRCDLASKHVSNWVASGGQDAICRLNDVNVYVTSYY